MIAPQGTEPAAGSLESLAADAAALEAGAATGAATPAAPVVDPAKLAADEAGQVVALVSSIALPMIAWRFGDAVAAAYGPRQLEAIANSLGTLAHVRGWSVVGVLGKWGPEIALAAALAGPALPFVLAAVRDRKAAAPAAPTAAAEAAPPTVPDLPPAVPGDDGRVT